MNQRGFTLLELLMVVVIIAILAGLALPQYIKASEKARAAEAFSFLGAVRESEMRYRAQSSTNSYAGNTNDIDVEFSASSLWALTAPTFSTSGSGTAAKGFVTVSRTAGTYSGQYLGVSFGTGATCGNYAPVFNALVTCTAN